MKRILEWQAGQIRLEDAQAVLGQLDEHEKRAPIDSHFLLINCRGHYFPHAWGPHRVAGVPHEYAARRFDNLVLAVDYGHFWRGYLYEFAEIRIRIVEKVTIQNGRQRI